MLFIECPWCGYRDDAEFHYGGEGHISRPDASKDLTDEKFAEYLFLKTNTKGLLLERWCHRSGCRRWFNVLRNTITNEILEVYPITDTPKSKEGKKIYEGNWRRKSVSRRVSKAGEVK